MIAHNHNMLSRVVRVNGAEQWVLYLCPARKRRWFKCRWMRWEREPVFRVALYDNSVAPPRAS